MTGWIYEIEKIASAEVSQGSHSKSNSGQGPLFVLEIRG